MFSEWINRDSGCPSWFRLEGHVLLRLDFPCLGNLTYATVSRSVTCFRVTCVMCFRVTCVMCFSITCFRVTCVMCFRVTCVTCAGAASGRKVRCDFTSCVTRTSGRSRATSAPNPTSAKVPVVHSRPMTCFTRRLDIHSHLSSPSELFWVIERRVEMFGQITCRRQGVWFLNVFGACGHTFVCQSRSCHL